MNEPKKPKRKRRLCSAESKAEACLIVELPGERECKRVFLPAESRITVGRAPLNEICIPDCRVSRIHAAFFTMGAESYIEPLIPPRAVAVNGVLVHKSTKLAVGDVITIPGSLARITFGPSAS